MALVNCPECGAKVSDKAEKCPQCSYPINVFRQANPVVKSQEGYFLQTLNVGCMIVAILIGLFLLIGILSSLS